MGISITTVLQFMAEDKQTYWIIIIIAFGFLFQSTNVIELYFRAQVQSKFAVRAQVVQLFITSLFKIYLVWSKADLVWFAVALMHYLIREWPKSKYPVFDFVFAHLFPTKKHQKSIKQMSQELIQKRAKKQKNT